MDANQLKGYLAQDFPDSEISSEVLPSGRIACDITWDGFSGWDPALRQAQIWSKLEMHYPDKDELLDIAAILAFTPQEKEEIAAD